MLDAIFLLIVVVTAASVQDRDGARAALTGLAARFPAVGLVWADGGYAGRLVEWTAAAFRLVVQIVKRSDDMRGFVALPRRWAVERTFGWLVRNRRLARDYERITANSEAMIKIAMIRLMAARLAGEQTKWSNATEREATRRIDLANQSVRVDSVTQQSLRCAVIKLVSVVTPVHGGVRYLDEAYESLRSQEIPVGWDWEWLIQEDGETGDVIGRLPGDPRIKHGQGRHGGPGVARTLALARSRGSLVKVLDVDDLLAAGALRRDIAVLDAYPEIGWTTSDVLDLMPDGSTWSFDRHPPPGPMAPGWLFDLWLAHDHWLPVHPASLCIRRDLVLALGGWMALPASEDTGLLIAASMVSTGYFIAETGLIYRKWPGQATAAAAHADSVERAARIAIIRERARVLRRGHFVIQDG